MIHSQVARQAPEAGDSGKTEGQSGLPADPALVLVLLGTVAALCGQWLVGRNARGEWVALVYASAVALFLAGVAGWAPSRVESAVEDGPAPSGPPPPGRRGAGVRWPLAAAALALGAVSFLASGGTEAPLGPRELAVLCQGAGARVLQGNQFTPLGVTSWVLAVALGLAACWQRDGAPSGQPSGQPSGATAGPGWGARLRRLSLDRPAGLGAGAGGAVAERESERGGSSGARGALRLSWTAIALGAVILCGTGVLFFRLDQVPAEMTSDHAEKLLDAQTVLDGQRPIFFPCNTGREALQFYLIAAMTPLTGDAGPGYLTMKLGTALVAATTLPFTFLFARVIGGTGLALLATAVLASTRWLWQVGRVGLRFPFPPAFGAAIFYFLVKALVDRRRNDFLLCGLVLGAAQHSYTALRFAPLAVLACVGIALLADARRRDRPDAPARRGALLTDTALLFAIAGLVSLPLLSYALDQPYAFFFRGASRLASDSLAAPLRDLLPVLLDNVRRALLMFNWRGDVVWVNTIPGEPILDPLSGAFFVLGCAYALYRVLRRGDVPYLYLLVLLFVGLLPSILSLAYPGENPSTVRAGMALPPTAVLVALPMLLLTRRLASWVGGSSGVWAGGIALAALLVPVARINAEQYFRVYAWQHSAASQHSAKVAQAVAGFLALGGRREDVYVIPWQHWFDTRLLAIQVGDLRWEPILWGVEEARRTDGLPRPRLYLVHPDDGDALASLSRWYPGAAVHVHDLRETGGQPYLVTVLVPPGTVAAAQGEESGAARAGVPAASTLGR
jgi:hypothetical protein